SGSFLFGDIDGAHATGAEEALDGVFADAGSRREDLVGAAPSRPSASGRAMEGDLGREVLAVEEVLGLGMEAEEGADLGGEGSVAGAQGDDAALPALGRQRRDIKKDLLGPTVGLGRRAVIGGFARGGARGLAGRVAHGPAPPAVSGSRADSRPTSRISQARAKVPSLRTVAEERFSAEATSSLVRPAKYLSITTSHLRGS